MGRKRQIDPEYPFEKEIARLSIPCRYFYILAWCHMDDTNGVLPYDAYKLKGLIFPTDDIDMEAIIQGVIAERRIFPFDADNKKWLWCPTLLKHQTINHPSKKKYPDPPKRLREDYRSGKLALTQSRVELSRVEKEAGPSAALKERIKRVHAEGLNMSALINRLKKKMGWKPEDHFPEEVLIKVCDQYFKQKTIIKKPWAWFIRVIEAECGIYYAQKNREEGEKFKKAPVALSLKEIMGKIK